MDPLEFSGGFQTPQYLTLTDSASLQFGAGDFAIFFVAQYSNALTRNGAGQGTFYNKVAGNTVPTGPQLYGNAGTGTNKGLAANIRARIHQPTTSTARPRRSTTASTTASAFVETVRCSKCGWTERRRRSPRTQVATST